MGVREQLARLERQVRADTSLSPPEPDDRCPRCGRTDLREPDREQLLTLLEWSVADLEAADEELGASISSPYACLAWCPACVRLVVVMAEEVGLGYPPRHERDRGLLRHLVPCPYWAWCVARTGKTCDHCSGKGVLVRDDPDATTPAPPPPTPTPAPAPAPESAPLPHGLKGRPPLLEGADPDEWEWVPDDEEDDNGMA
jgi:hypothetical protein